MLNRKDKFQKPTRRDKRAPLINIKIRYHFPFHTKIPHNFCLKKQIDTKTAVIAEISFLTNC